MKLKTWTIALAVSGSILTSAALAGAIEDRQKAMKAVGKSIGAIAAIVKGEAEFDAAVVKANADTIASSFKVVKPLFPEDSNIGKPKTRAKAEIWQDMATFEQKLANGIAAAEGVSKVTMAEALGPALGQLGGACNACHEKFRAPKD